MNLEMVSLVIQVIAGWIDSARMERLWSSVERVAFTLVPLRGRNALYMVLAACILRRVSERPQAGWPCVVPGRRGLIVGQNIVC